MTMQIGMVGSDGTILASDTQWTRNIETLRNGRHIGQVIRSWTNRSKIKTNGHMVVSCALDKKTADTTAEAILLRFNGEAPEASIQEIADSIPEAERWDAQGLIVIPPFQLFRFQLAMQEGQWTPFCEPSDGFDIAGDMGTPAIFWIHRFYHQFLTAEQLIPLAAHMIMASHHLNTAGIGGLEIVVCKEGGNEFLPREETVKLQKAAWDRDKAIEKMIFGNDASLQI
ncbi:MAG: hypothetical protein ABSG62_07755 [Terracidiphilus sp.]